jgi:hypothetical protein
LKRIIIYFLSSLCLLLAPLCRAENCAWLNAATAGGLLGGDVTMKVTHTSAADTTCEFTLKRAGVAATLEIAVHTMSMASHDYPAYVALCGSTTMPLRAVGNEAVECSLKPTPERRSEQIVSRVRDRVFLLKWTMPASDSSASSLSRDELHDRIRNVAEQVAGSLF